MFYGMFFTIFIAEDSHIRYEITAKHESGPEKKALVDNIEFKHNSVQKGKVRVRVAD